MRVRNIATAGLVAAAVLLPGAATASAAPAAAPAEPPTADVFTTIGHLLETATGLQPSGMSLVQRALDDIGLLIPAAR